MAGIQFPANEKGDRSTTSFNKEVFSAMANSLGAKDLEDKIKSEKDWRHKYSVHLDQVVERTLKLQDASALSAVLTKGLEKARSMDFESGSVAPGALSQAMTASAAKFTTSKVAGSGSVVTDLVVPYNGHQLKGSELEGQCDQWSSYGTMEADCATAIKTGAKKLGEMKGRTFLVLGAGSELGPVRPLLEVSKGKALGFSAWPVFLFAPVQAGATVAAVATRRPKRWAELIALARKSAGTLLLPVSPQSGEVKNDEDLAAVAGADLLTETPQILEWLLRCGREATGKVTMGTYLYADGEANVRLTAASDFIVEALKSLGKDKVSFAYLSSCSTSTAIPAEAIQAQEANFNTAGRWATMFGERQNCKKLDDGTFFLSGFEVLQGPNYALAQMMRQWRAALLHMEGFTVSAPMAPICRTESVVHNATMAVLLEGIAHFPPQESYDAETGRMAMLAILISDLTEPSPKLASPLHVVTRKAFHSGIWCTPFVMASLGKTTWFLGKVAPKRAA